MAQVFNPWTDPPKLTGDLASFELNDASAGEAPESHEAMMAQSLQVISQQAELIAKLMASMGSSAESDDHE